MGSSSEFWWLPTEAVDLTVACNSTWPNDVFAAEWDQPTDRYANTSTLSPGQPIGLGIGCELLGALLVALGLALIKRASNSEKRRRAHRQRPYPMRWMWWVGILTYALGQWGAFCSLALTASSLVVLLSLSALVWNVMLSRFVAGESVGVATLACDVAICCGLVLMALFTAPTPKGLWTAASLAARWREPEVWAFMVAHGSCTLVAVLVLLVYDGRLACSKEGRLNRRVSRENMKRTKASAPDAPGTGQRDETLDIPRPKAARGRSRASIEEGGEEGDEAEPRAKRSRGKRAQRPDGLALLRAATMRSQQQGAPCGLPSPIPMAGGRGPVIARAAVAAGSPLDSLVACSSAASDGSTSPRTLAAAMTLGSVPLMPGGGVGTASRAKSPLRPAAAMSPLMLGQGLRPQAGCASPRTMEAAMALGAGFFDLCA